MSVFSDIHRVSQKTGKGHGPTGVIYVGVCVGLFTQKHMQRMGNDIYTYGYLLSCVTGWNSRYSIGAVLKGAVLKYSQIADDTGINERTVRRHIKSLEAHGYIIILRRPRGNAYYITNYRPAGKPRLGQGECPPLAVLKLSELASHGLVSGQQVAECVGINEHLINTENAVSKHRAAIMLQPMADIYILLDRLFGEQLGTAELRFLHRGDKHTKHFVMPEDLLKAIGRLLRSHETKKAKEELSGNKPRGITNIVAYLNAGLHGPRKYLLNSVRDEEPYIERVRSLHSEIQSEIKEFKKQFLAEKGKESCQS